VQVRSDILVALRLLNAARFSSGMSGAVGAVREFHAELDAATTASERLSAVGTLSQGGLLALGTAVKGVSIGLGALAATTVGFGIQFDATMQSNTLAFSRFAGGAKQAQLFTKDLFQIAANTPFSFSDITMAGRRLLAFGFNVEETTGLLKTMGDTISVTGGGTDEILRLAKALGDIRAKGRLMQQEMNQLANVGIPIRDILARGGLELTADQLTNIGRAGIPAQQAIDAIQAGLNDMYGGGAQQYLQTFTGQWQRLRDNLRQAAGSATSNAGLFGWMTNGIKFLNQSLPAVNKFFAGDTFKSISGTVGSALKTGFGAIVDGVRMLFDALKPAQPFFKHILLPLLKGVGVALLGLAVGGFKIAIFVIKAFAEALGLIGKIAGALHLDKIFMLIGFVIGTFFGPWLIRVIEWLGKFSIVFRLAADAVRVILIPIRLLGAAFQSLFGRIANVVASMGFMTRFRSILVGGFKSVFLELGKLPGQLGLAMIRLGIKIGDAIFTGMRQRLIHALASVFGLAVGIGPKQILHALHVPGFAAGGLLEGIGLVGEHGPELAQHTSGGTIITPLRGGAAPSFASAGGNFNGGLRAHFSIPVYIGRKQVAEAVGEYISDRRARA
jgi:hypothetical protein